MLSSGGVFLSLGKILGRGLGRGRFGSTKSRLRILQFCLRVGESLVGGLLLGQGLLHGSGHLIELFCSCLIRGLRLGNLAINLALEVLRRSSLGLLSGRRLPSSCIEMLLRNSELAASYIARLGSLLDVDPRIGDLLLEAALRGGITAAFGDFDALRGGCLGRFGTYVCSRVGLGGGGDGSCGSEK